MKKYVISLQFKALREEGSLYGPECHVDRPDRVCSYMGEAFESNPFAEQIWVILLDRKNKPLGRHQVTSGTATSSLAHPREVYRAAILANACAIICVHNHPSGDPCPSSADIMITRQLREAGKTVDIELLDHVIVGRPTADPLGRGYYSFRDAGLI